MDALKKLTEGQLKTEAPEVVVGNTVKVHVNIKEGDRENSDFRGNRHCKERLRIAETFTVRRVSYGVGVGACFPGSFPQCCQGRDRPQRPCSPQQALLSA